MIALPFQDREPRNHLDKAGIEAERQLAHYLCRKFGQDPRVDLFFGLRLPVEKTSTPTRHDAVQIDALLIHPHGMAIVESKSVHAHVRVNSRGEWCRTYQGEERGMPSPVEQVHRQADALRELLNEHKHTLRGRKLLGQGSFRCCPIECFVAISDNAIIQREHPDLAPEVVKADQIARRVEARIMSHRKFGGFVGLFRHAAAKEETDDGMWSLTEEERGRVREWLMGVAGK